MKKRIVCIGGGNGTARILKGLKKYDVTLTGIIAVTDSGRSTGRARLLANIPAPGDIRNALVSLSNTDRFYQNLFQFRFQNTKIKDLEGMAFGNLFIAALSQMCGSFERAIEKTSRFLKVKGSIIPIILTNSHIACERKDGSADYEELNVRTIGKSPIKRLFLRDKNVVVNPKAIAAIQKAHLVVLGPGSLYTTIIACLLSPTIKKALKETKAKVVFIMNTTRQPGQTDQYSIAEHLTALQNYLYKKTVDVCLINTGKPNAIQAKRLAKEGVTPLSFTENDRSMLKKQGVDVLEKDLIEEKSKRKLWNKQDTICHDPSKISRALYDFLKTSS